MSFSRRCGSSRTAGHLYLESNTGPNGVSILSLLCCPTEPITLEHFRALGGSALGMTAVEYEGPDGQPWIDVLDWIGESHYPYVWDWIQECRAAPTGISRALAADPKLIKAFDPAVPGYYIPIHSRGHLLNAHEFYSQRAVTRCAKNIGEHLDPARLNSTEDTCVSLLLEAYAELDAKDTMSPSDPTGRLFTRWQPEPAARYNAYLAPTGLQPEFSPAIIARIPKTMFHFSLIQGPEAEVNQRAAVLKDHAKLPWEIVEE